MSNVTSYGWMGKILRIDLTKRETREESTLKYTDKFIGGRGINVKLLYDEVPPEVDAFGPENRIIFGSGPLTGTPVPGGKMQIVSKSPLTDILGRSSMGGHCAAELKFCGYDHLIVQGKADSPVYVYISDDMIEIKDAGDLWGKDTYETQRLLRDKHHQQVKVLCIGPAGENMVRFATIQSGLGNASGRTGLGAVMGSKNLKAIAFSGSKGVKVARPEEFLNLTYEMQKRILDYFSALAGGRRPRALDLSGDHFEELGHLVVGNFETSIGPTVKIKNLLEEKGRPYGCPGCFMPCKQVFDLPEVGLVTGTCIFQGMAGAFWTDNLKSWAEVVTLTQKLGIDQGSLMFLIAFIIEMYSKGLIKLEDIDGIPMHKGNMDGVISLVHKIASREGCGEIFAEGTLKAAKKLGRDLERYVMHNKGLELLCIEIRNKKVSALAAAISTRGDFQTEAWPLGDFVNGNEELKEWVKGFAMSHHLKEEFIESFLNPLSYDHAGQILRHFQPITAIVDLIGWCKWISPHMGCPVFPDDQAKFVSAATNIDINGKDLLEAADRVCNLERAYNARVGKTREDDSLPERFFTETLKARFGNGEILDRDQFEKMKDEYYELRGWEVKTGIPTSKTLEELDLKDVAADLKKRKVI